MNLISFLSKNFLVRMYAVRSLSSWLIIGHITTSAACKHNAKIQKKKKNNTKNVYAKVQGDMDIEWFEDEVPINISRDLTVILFKHVSQHINISVHDFIFFKTSNFWNNFIAIPPQELICFTKIIMKLLKRSKFFLTKMSKNLMVFIFTLIYFNEFFTFHDILEFFNLLNFDGGLNWI